MAKRHRPIPRAAPKTTAGTRAKPDWLVFALAALGMAVTAYLSYSKWQAAGLAFCEAGSGCDLIQASRWSQLLGLPMAFWGFMTYLALAVVAVGFPRPRTRWRCGWALALTGFAISVYLTVIGLSVLAAACLWCLASLALVAAILALLWMRRPAPTSASWLVGTAAGALLAVLALHLHYSGVFDPTAGPEDPYLRGLAEHLSRQHARFFGAYWCPHCQQQKALFGASARRLPYVECTPHGRNKPRADVCIDARITSYPTWVIGGRRFERTMDVESLARDSGYRPPAPEPD